MPSQPPLSRDPKRADRAWDVLEPALFKALEWKVVPGVVANRTGHQDAARLGGLLQTGGNVDAVAEDIPVCGDDVSDVDTDAKQQGAANLPALSLHVDCEADSTDCACELCQEAITHRLDDAAVVLLSGRMDHIGK
jgi:hypothetical protein